jgi:hypothetical protein
MVRVKDLRAANGVIRLADRTELAKRATPGATGIRWHRAFSAREALVVRRDVHGWNQSAGAGRGLALVRGSLRQDAGQWPGEPPVRRA